MDIDTDSKMSSLVSAHKRWTEVHSDLGSGLESTPFPKHSDKSQILEIPTKISSVLFQKVSVSKMDSNVEMLSNVQTVEEHSQSSDENTCKKP